MTSPGSNSPKIASLADLFAIAYQIEADAVDRYVVLATQMEVHNNMDLASAFRDLAVAEAIHRDEIQRMAGDIDVVARARIVARWSKGDSPEAADLAAAHYLMTPWHALQLALEGEQRALAFFTAVAETAGDPAIRKMAAEFVEEEVEHVNLVNRLLLKHPKPETSWSDDPDPPNPQE
jgi:rubrerythrin